MSVTRAAVEASKAAVVNSMVVAAFSSGDTEFLQEFGGHAAGYMIDKSNSQATRDAALAAFQEFWKTQNRTSSLTGFKAYFVGCLADRDRGLYRRQRASLPDVEVEIAIS